MVALGLAKSHSPAVAIVVATVAQRLRLVGRRWILRRPAGADALERPAGTPHHTGDALALGTAARRATTRIVLVVGPGALVVDDDADLAQQTQMLGHGQAPIRAGGRGKKQDDRRRQGRWPPAIVMAVRGERIRVISARPATRREGRTYGEDD